MSIHDEVNLIIFRIPDVGPEDREHEHDDGFRLVELPYLGRKLAEVGTVFAPTLDDEVYRSLGYNRIILARTTAEGSRELARYQVIPEKNDPETICETSYNALVKVVQHLVKEYDAERAQSS